MLVTIALNKLKINCGVPTINFYVAPLHRYWYKCIIYIISGINITQRNINLPRRTVDSSLYWEHIPASRNTAMTFLC